MESAPQHEAERILTKFLPGDITPEEIDMMTWLLEGLGYGRTH